MHKPVVLTFLAHYLPGYKSGGPVRTIANLVDHLGDEFDFRIVTSDRDATDTHAYPNVVAKQWIQVGKAWVYYLSPRDLCVPVLRHLLGNTPHDIVYLNSFFNPSFTLRPRLAQRSLGSRQRIPTIVAPRGEFSPGALRLKVWKKWPYRLLTGCSGLFHNLTWQASSRHEADDIRRRMGRTARRIVVAPNLPPPVRASLPHRPRNRDEPLRIVFVGRIAPMKNLAFALKILTQVNCPVTFSIYGPISDNAYWDRCQQHMVALPKEITVDFHGPIPSDRICQIVADHDLFFLPTLGENYGHAIAEALTVGTPILIADTTPWKGLKDAGAGWDLSLNDATGFINAIHFAASLTAESYEQWRCAVKKYALSKLSATNLIEANRDMFLQAMESTL